jgi:hypothetical protein
MANAMTTTTAVKTASIGYQKTSIPSLVGSFTTQSTSEIQAGVNAAATQRNHQWDRTVARATAAMIARAPRFHPSRMPSVSLHCVTAGPDAPPGIVTAGPP